MLGSSSSFVVLGSLAFLGVILLVASLLFIGLVIFFTRRGSSGSTSAEGQKVWPVYSRRLMSQPEQVLYGRLVEALPGKLIFSQVQLTRIIEVKNVPNRISWVNKLIRLSVDFVVCNPDTSVLAVIELDDASHGRSSRQDSDSRKNEALAAAGVRIIRWRVNELPSIESIRQQLDPSG